MVMGRVRLRAAANVGVMLPVKRSNKQHQWIIITCGLHSAITANQPINKHKGGPETEEVIKFTESS